MSYYKDEHMIFRSYDKEALIELRNQIVELMREEFKGTEVNYGNYLSPILSTPAGLRHYLFLPEDGSKEGWEVSNCMDEVREKIREHIIYHNAKNPNERIYALCVDQDDYQKTPITYYLGEEKC